MKSSINVLVVDNDVNLTNEIKKYFSSNEVIKVVECTNDGIKALDYISNNNSIDVILMDLLIPGLDGIELLSELKRKNINKDIIVLTNFKDYYAVEQANKYGVKYYMLKPVNLISLEKRLLSLCNLNHVPLDTEERLSSLLHELGMPSHVRGFQYIRDAIILMENHPNDILCITKDIYPELAVKYNSTPSRIERAIRHAIEICWIRGDIQTMSKIFGNSIDINKDKPSNAQFIKTILDSLKYKTIFA